MVKRGWTAIALPANELASKRFIETARRRDPETSWTALLSLEPPMGWWVPSGYEL
jgi:hypothetical protein